MKTLHIDIETYIPDGEAIASKILAETRNAKSI